MVVTKQLVLLPNELTCVLAVGRMFVHSLWTYDCIADDKFVSPVNSLTYI